MAIITISRHSFSLGSTVAEKVARNLSYGCISREVLLEASEKYDIPEIKLSHAIEYSPSIFDRLTYGKEKYVAYIQSALLRHLRKDNVVYHGLAGQFFLQDISHVLKVQIIADLEDRIELYMERIGGTRKAAIKFFNRLDSQRRKWGKNLYGIDTWDSRLYDLILHMQNMTSDEAADVICQTARLKSFQTTPESQKKMEDMFLASEVKVALINLRPDVEVSVKDGFVHIKTMDEDEMERESIIEEIEDLVKEISGVKETEVQVIPF